MCVCVCVCKSVCVPCMFHHLGVPVCVCHVYFTISLCSCVCCIVNSLVMRGVLRLSDVAAVFTASQPLLHWAYSHEPLRNRLAKNWVRTVTQQHCTGDPYTNLNRLELLL